MRIIILTLALLVLFGVPAQAQTAVNGNSGFAFAPSTDHDVQVVLPDGTLADAITQYEGDIVTAAGGALFFTYLMPKSGLVVNGGEITVRPFSVLGTLNYGTVYTLVIRAVGPGGVGRSVPSDPFVRPVPPMVAPNAPGKARVLP
jgi:hypothetical protein